MNQNKKIEDEIKFSKLLKSPIRLFGWTYVYFFLLIVALGIFFVNNIIPISFNQMPVSPPDFSNVKPELFAKRGEVIPAVNISEIKNPTSAIIENGKKLYESNCATCHGVKGLGEGPAGAVMNPKPRNFADVNGWTNGKSVDQIYRTLQEGIISRGMSAYEYLSPADRFYIILYMRTLVNLPPITDELLSAIDKKYNFSAGTMIPNQISAEKALELLVKEKSVDREKVTLIKQKFIESKEKSSLIIDNVIDSETLIKFFLANPSISLEQFQEQAKTAPKSIGLKYSILRLDSSQFSELYKYIRQLTS